jgi:4-methyl-5(b-hydroxyethyl)-thiazole monophosphate biosynthesis
MASVLIPLAQGCEELEAVTVIDLMRRANIEVVTAGLDDQPVKGARSTVLVPDTQISKVADRKFDMIVLPGGLAGAENLNSDPRIHELLKRMSKEGKYVAAICAAPKVLATAGLLEHKKATSFPGVLEKLALPLTELTTRAVQIDGTLITSRGPGTAMDFALKLIEVLLGQKARDEVEAPLQRPAYEERPAGA